MPFFAQGDLKNKLTILYFVRTAQWEITREQLYRAMIENNCMSYFEFQVAMAEMEEDGYLMAIPCMFGQVYRVTASGKDTLHMFEESLPFSLRTSLETYAEANRESMIRETQLVSSMEELYGGGYRVHLRVQDSKSSIVEISFDVISRSMAQRIRAGWQEIAGDVYMRILTSLLEAGEKAEHKSEE